MHSHVLRIGLLAIVFCLLLLPAPALANGSASDPHILSRPNTSAILRGDVIPHLEITKGWVQVKGDRAHFILEVASLPQMQDIPKDAVYVFHYTYEAGRMYWRAEWNAAGQFDFFGGMYVGCRPPVCPAEQSFDPQGNRNYFYMPGNESQVERVQSEVIPGAPGRLVWTYPLAGYADDPHGLEFKGLFAATYTKNSNGALQYADIALGVKDFMHLEQPPWHARLRAMVPGPSPILLVLGVLAVVAVIARRSRDE